MKKINDKSNISNPTTSEIISFINSKNYILKGSKNKRLYGFNSISAAKKGEITFCAYSGKKGKHLITSSNASIIICPLDLEKKINKKNSSLIFVQNPRLWFYRCLTKFVSTKKLKGIHSSAIIKTKFIGKDVYIGPFVFIGENVKIGNNTKIFGHVFIQNNTSIGKNVIIQPSTVVGAASYGPQRNELLKLETHQNLGNVIIKDDVEIGSNTSILSGALEDTIIGAGSKISDLVYIGSGMKIGQNCMITGHTYFGGSSVIEDNVYVAPGAIIRNGITLKKNCFVGMGAVVTKDVFMGSTVIGIPARPIKHNLDSNYIRPKNAN